MRRKNIKRLGAWRRRVVIYDAPPTFAGGGGPVWFAGGGGGRAWFGGSGGRGVWVFSVDSVGLE